MRLYLEIKVLLAAFTLWVLAGSASIAETRLIMFESTGCPYCELWNEQVGDAYHKTTEGARAPLLRMDISDEIPEELTIGNAVVYTPTFVLIDDGQEIDRITGYPGEDFFWSLLNRMLTDLPENEEEMEGS